MKKEPQSENTVKTQNTRYTTANCPACGTRPSLDVSYPNGEDSFPEYQFAFRLPANVQAASKALNNQVQSRLIPRKFQNDVPQARRVAWRIVRQWIEAQMALIQLGQVKLEQVFLPYAQNASGQTLYEALVENKFSGLALEQGAAA